MNVEELRAYCLAKKGVTEEFPFDEVTLVFKVMGKMFALVPLERLPSQVNLKCDPERSLELREQYDGVVTPAFHMSKTHWNTLFFEQLPSTLLASLTDHSYELVIANFTKKLRSEYDSL
ncbi:MmcQ/YjbR family DNA-binding protein [Muriicola soli]|uniref:MmcQ/YjbR family DNA-binding protein n=1 Tax=Muriicola soli TaxID=2507538 RepID=A0A411E6Y0_9FLAO|nr:MmcQ/YjbR family DNA-binding protein [Muriicola soli]QBA63250.1 MmcQ/YjbR family DNA-binding protein [Muriicola soli]